jgi:hypothetical protein
MRLLCVIWILASICCAPPPTGSPGSTGQSLKQGIQGQVFQLPTSADSLAKENPEAGVQREVHIYELTTLDQTSHENGIFRSIPTQKVLSITTRADGRFKVKLPPGTYSVFVQEPGGLFANLFQQNRINPVVVKPRQYTWISITIEYPGL